MYLWTKNIGIVNGIVKFNIQLSCLYLSNATSTDLNNACNSGCSCKENTFVPLCSEGLTYVNPCKAGCKKIVSATVWFLCIKYIILDHVQRYEATLHEHLALASENFKFICIF